MYMNLDTLVLNSSVPFGSLSTMSADAPFFVAEQLEAYARPLSIVLLSIAEFPGPSAKCPYTHPSFLRNVSWMVPTLSRLILCSSRATRKQILGVYDKLVNPFIMNAVGDLPPL